MCCFFKSARSPMSRSLRGALPTFSKQPYLRLKRAIPSIEKSPQKGLFFDLKEPYLRCKRALLKHLRLRELKERCHLGRPQVGQIQAHTRLGARRLWRRSDKLSVVVLLNVLQPVHTSKIIVAQQQRHLVSIFVIPNRDAVVIDVNLLTLFECVVEIVVDIRVGVQKISRVTVELVLSNAFIFALFICVCWQLHFKLPACILLKAWRRTKFLDHPAKSPPGPEAFDTHAHKSLISKLEEGFKVHRLILREYRCYMRRQP
mmetsp:Transcript_61862/g.90672  ORF Transcript_61862/g.90672 Transcript_61862/m.90672 type:complete len:259 (-) Transcript_61862:1663-2439(-)